MLKRFIIPALVVTLLLGTVAIDAGETGPTPQATQVAPAFQGETFTFTDIQGKKIDITVTKKGIRLPTFPDKNAILIFFIHSGTPCRNELQLFSKLKPELKSLEFVGFELKGLKPDQLQAFAKELKLKGLHLIDSAQAMPFAQYIAKLIRWPGSVPLIIAVTKNGEVKHMQLGAMKEAEIKKLAETLEK